MQWKKSTIIIAVVIIITGFWANGWTAERLRLSTTTSTDNTGLLAHILPPFEKKHNVKVDVIAVGTGKALKLAENGDVDVTMVHAPKAEFKFVKAGFGVNRRSLMANYFMIAGPSEDSAGVNKASTAEQAFQMIAKDKVPFVSRGDNSGTHMKELEIWKKAGIKPEGTWYIEAGSGMGAVLSMADEKKGYTLTDRGTYLKYLDKIQIRGIFERNSETLYNPYAVIAVNPARHPKVKYELAMALIAWLTSPDGQAMIGGFKDKTGKVLFTPLAVPMK